MKLVNISAVIALRDKLSELQDYLDLVLTNGKTRADGVVCDTDGNPFLCIQISNCQTGDSLNMPELLDVVASSLRDRIHVIKSELKTLGVEA
jgi:hypothetical protein